jgi:hypothetical protein
MSRFFPLVTHSVSPLIAAVALLTLPGALAAQGDGSVSGRQLELYEPSVQMGLRWRP